MAERFYLDFSYTITTGNGATVSPSVLHCINIQRPMTGSGLNSPWGSLGPMLELYASNGYEIYIRLYRRTEDEKIISVIEIPTVIEPYAPNTIYPDIMESEKDPEYSAYPPFVFVSANYKFMLSGVEANDTGKTYICNFYFMYDSNDSNNRDANIGVAIFGGNSTL